jgi:HEAT repeat protein
LIGVVRSAVPAQDWIPGDAVEVESRLEAAIGYACGIAMLSDLADERQVNLLTFALNGPDWAGRRAAAEALGNLQPHPIASAPFLEEALGDSEYQVAWAAEAALKGMLADPRVYDLVVAGLGDPAAGVRRYSLRLLAAQPERPAEQLDPVMVLFNDEDVYVRQEARFWLARCEPREIVGLMVAELAGPDDERRSEAAQVLKSCGDSAYTAVPALTAMLLDDNPEMREAAASSLGSIADNNQSVVNGLTQAVHVETDSQALEAEIYAIKTLDGEATAFALLQEALQSPLPGIRGSACGIMIDYTGMPGALELLVATLDDPDSGVRIAAAVSLIYFGDDALPVVPKLIAMLADPEPSVSYQVRFALETITNQTFGDDAALWTTWWEQNHP